MRCPVWSTPPAALPISGSTSMSANVWLGVISIPWPQPMTNRGGASTSVGVVRGCMCPATAAMAIAPIPNVIAPATTSLRPSRVTTRPERGGGNGAPHGVRGHTEGRLQRGVAEPTLVEQGKDERKSGDGREEGQRECDAGDVGRPSEQAQVDQWVARLEGEPAFPA